MSANLGYREAIDRIGYRISVALAQEGQTHALRTRLTLNLSGSAGRAAQANVDQIALLIRNYVESIPALLSGIHGATGDPARVHPAAGIPSGARRSEISRTGR